MKKRVILHSDLNNFYASVESLYHPELLGKPLAVIGDPEARHGIVLAKNYEARAFDVKTGDTMWQAKQKCPGITFLPPHMDMYVDYSKKVRKIYSQYTDKVESFGLDECWLDVTESTNLFGSGKEIADDIRQRVKHELGVSVSIGVSFNKIFAKLGSDMKKPDATTVIERDSYKEVIWKLPVNELLFVGRSTYDKLKRKGVFTIGDLANTQPELLRFWLGKAGITLWQFANGLDNSPVSDIDAKPLVKSVGNSTTTYRDLITEQDVKIVLMQLSESVSQRLRKHGFVCKTIQVGIRDTGLNWIERQGKLETPNRTAKEIFQLAWELVRNNLNGSPVRSLGVRACDLEKCLFQQMSLFSDLERIEKQEKLETAVDNLRERFGNAAVQKGIALADKKLSGIDGIGEKTEHHSCGISLARQLSA